MSDQLKGTATGAIMVAVFPDGTRQLQVQINIDCPECGQFSVHIPGHHTRVIRDMCLKAIDEYPDLTESMTTVTESITYRVPGLDSGSGDPSNN